jgi:cytidylate kinase
MHIVSISRGSQSLGIEFAKHLSGKLGYEMISREDLLEEATRQRIPVGKLETAIVKPHIYSQRLAVELEHYKALATSILCEKALDHDIVYHGRTGHLLLPGVDNIFKIRVVSDMEHRIAKVMDQLNLPRKKAKQYIEAVEEDRRKWVKKFYNVEWDVYTLYDMVVNLSQINAANAAAAACAMAQLPEFQSTPASVAALKDLLLASRARLILARNEKTRDVNVAIMAVKGVVNVTYSFQQADKADAIMEALKELTGAKQVVCTEAQTNVLWIQEAFSPDEGGYNQVLALAKTWDAAVEILKMKAGDEFARYPVDEDIARKGLETWRQTGIIDEQDDYDAGDPEDISQIYERLINDGRAGGKRIIEGSRQTLLNAIGRSGKYRLIVFDNMFLGKGAEARKRMTQEWSNTLSDSLKTPVVSLGEIQARYRFGANHAVRMAVAAILAAIILFMVFQYDDAILNFLRHEGTTSRVLATICILVFIPVFAYIYSTATGLFLRMIKLD